MDVADGKENSFTVKCSRHVASAKTVQDSSISRQAPPRVVIRERASLPTRRERMEQKRAISSRRSFSFKHKNIFTATALAVLVAGTPIGIYATNAFQGESSTNLAERSQNSKELTQSLESNKTSLSHMALTGTKSQDLYPSLNSASRNRVRANAEVDLSLSSQEKDSVTAVAPYALYYPMMEGSYTITSPFGPREAPVPGAQTFHEGNDYAGPPGTPIYSVADGEVVELLVGGGWGSYLRIRHETPEGEVFFSAYGHQSPSEIRVKVGDHVKAGQRIGAVGNGGFSTGPHLHFEIRDRDNHAVDPAKWLPDHGVKYFQGDHQ